MEYTRATKRGGPEVVTSSIVDVGQTYDMAATRYSACVRASPNPAGCCYYAVVGYWNGPAGIVCMALSAAARYGHWPAVVMRRAIAESVLARAPRTRNLRRRLPFCPACDGGVVRGAGGAAAAITGG